MPPKRKRAETVTTAIGSTARSTHGASSKTTRAQNFGGTDVIQEAPAESPSKRTRAAAKKTAAASHKNRGTKASPRVFGGDDVPLNSSTSQQQSDDGLGMHKQTSSIVSTEIEYTPQRAQALFTSFADDDNTDVIGPGGVEKLCTEAGIPLEGAQPLILAWQFKTKEMAKLHRSEWLQGTEALRISSLPVLAMALKELDDLVVRDNEPITSAPSLPSVKKRGRVDLQEPYNRARYRQYALNPTDAFAELYQFCFTLSKPPQSRNLDIETAMALWSVSLTPRFPIVTRLIEFLSESGSYKGVNKDIWNMVYEFCRTVNGELSNYEIDGAWPTLLDDFVVWKRARVACSKSEVLALMDE